MFMMLGMNWDQWAELFEKYKPEENKPTFKFALQARKQYLLDYGRLPLGEELICGVKKEMNHDAAAEFFSLPIAKTIASNIKPGRVYKSTVRHLYD